MMLLDIEHTTKIHGTTAWRAIQTTAVAMHADGSGTSDFIYLLLLSIHLNALCQGNTLPQNIQG